VQEVLAQIPWYHHIALLEKCGSPEERLWYARESAAHGWSHNILTLQIEARLHERQGKAVTNFGATLPPAESDMAPGVGKLLEAVGWQMNRAEFQTALQGKPISYNVIYRACNQRKIGHCE
jgi:hypothetical protein